MTRIFLIGGYAALNLCLLAALIGHSAFMFGTVEHTGVAAYSVLAALAMEGSLAYVTIARLLARFAGEETSKALVVAQLALVAISAYINWRQAQGSGGGNSLDEVILSVTLPLFLAVNGEVGWLVLRPSTQSINQSAAQSEQALPARLPVGGTGNEQATEVQGGAPSAAFAASEQAGRQAVTLPVARQAHEQAGKETHTTRIVEQAITPNRQIVELPANTGGQVGNSINVEIRRNGVEDTQNVPASVPLNGVETHINGVEAGGQTADEWAGNWGVEVSVARKRLRTMQASGQAKQAGNRGRASLWMVEQAEEETSGGLPLDNVHCRRANGGSRLPPH